MKRHEVVFPSKRSRTDPLVDNVDRISNLPDNVMIRILSSIPTFDALKTCVFSKDWKYKWTSIDRIDISDQTDNWKATRSMFADIMERILLHTENLRTIRIRLVREYDSSLVKLWISILLRNKIESLDIDTRQTDLAIHAKHLDNTLLRELVLKSLTFTFRACDCFTSLKDLRLQELQLRNDSSMDVVSFTFPVLEMIELVRCTWLDVKVVEIHALALKVFKSETISRRDLADHYRINIHCADHPLGLLKATGGDLENLFVTGSKVVNAILENKVVWPFQKSVSRVQRLLETISSTLEDLTFPLVTASAITGSEQGCRLPMFDKVIRLNLTNTENRQSGYTAQALLEILRAMPILKFLVMDMVSKPKC